MDKRLDESAVQRAQTDLWRVWHSPAALGAVVVLDVLLAGGSAVLAASASSPSPAEIAAAAIVGAVGGTVLALGSVFLLQLMLAPVRQRDEARRMARPPDGPPFPPLEVVHFGAGEAKDIPVVLETGRTKVLCVEIRNSYPTHLSDIVLNFDVPQAWVLERCQRDGARGGGGHLTRPEGSDRQYWEVDKGELKGGGWANHMSFAITAPEAGEYQLYLKLGVPGFRSTVYQLPIAVHDASDTQGVSPR